MSVLLEMKDISKSFTGNKVLDGVRLEVQAGEVLALLGENGAGKSTLMKILGGIYSRDAGTIHINGKETDIQSVDDARKNGISIIHQELMLAQHITIAENIFMGQELLSRHNFINLKKQEEEAQKMLDLYHLQLSAGEVLKNLTIAQQQMVEIIRAVSFGSKIIVMDEPTSSLSNQEVDILYDMIRKLKKNNVGIVYISHRLNELYEITDRITVLRDGEFVGTVVTKEIERNKLIAMMVGRELSNYYTKTDTVRDEIVLEVEHLNDGNMVKDVSFQLRKGEILGVAGLVGAGRSETMKCIFGLSRCKGGTIKQKGREVRFKNPRKAMEEGFGFVSEDRKTEGLFLKQNVQFNTSITILHKFLRRLKFQRNIEKEAVLDTIQKMQIKVTGMKQTVSRLSGGNQQKVLIGRWLLSTESILILDEPTRGVDVKTKAEIYALIDKLAASGLSIIMVSSELPELINMSDRVMVLCGGVSTGILNRDELNQEAIMTLATTEAVSC